MYRIIIFIYFISLANLINAQKVEVRIHEDAVYFVENKDSILAYQIAEKSLNGAFKRTNYIHPIYGLDGQKLTEDFPADHPHHRGVFWAWRQLYIGDKRLGNSWEIKDFYWEISSVKELKVLGNAKIIQSKVLWKTNKWLDSDGKKKPVVKEITTIKVYPRENDYRQIDIQISLLALEKNMRIGGSENDKGYGGFSCRVLFPEDIHFTGSKGTIEPNKFPVKSIGWMDFSWGYGKIGPQAGLSILCHPDNPGAQDYWILRAKGSMQNAVYPFPGATSVPLSNKQPTILRYRLLVHQGNSETIDINKVYADYIKTNI
ncbi:MAG: PmoA family protein [Flavicella sp.]|nr:PmoA family protein [Flavicella sp.]